MTTLTREEPFVAAVESALLQSVCHSCFKHTPGRQLRCCSRCSTVHYCSPRCQKSDWPDHSAECRCLKNYLPRIPSCFVRLLARFYWKTSTQGATVTSFNSRRCSDLLDNCDKLVKSERHVEYFSSLFKILTEYMHGTDVADNRKELFSAYGKLVTNAFSITDISFATLGTGLYLGISAQNHSCIPDVFVCFEGSTAVMRSPEVGKKYDHNLTISYVDLMDLTEERNRILQDQFCFTCSCPACSSKAEDDWKMSVRTDCCDGGFCLVDSSGDWNAHPPSCVLCKKQVSISLKEAVQRNLSAKMELESTPVLSTMSAVEIFEHWSAVFQKYVKMLSPYNKFLVGISQRFLTAAESVGNTDISWSFAEMALNAYRRYLPRGHPELTQRLRHALKRRLTLCSREECQDLLIEAYNSAILSHGEEHPVTKELSSLLTLN